MPGYVFWPDDRHGGMPPVGFGFFRALEGGYELWLAGLEFAQRGGGHGRALLASLMSTPPGQKTYIVRIQRTITLRACGDAPARLARASTPSARRRDCAGSCAATRRSRFPRAFARRSMRAARPRSADSAAWASRRAPAPALTAIRRCARARDAAPWRRSWQRHARPDGPRRSIRRCRRSAAARA